MDFNVDRVLNTYPDDFKFRLCQCFCVIPVAYVMYEYILVVKTNTEILTNGNQERKRTRQQYNIQMIFFSI